MMMFDYYKNNESLFEDSDKKEDFIRFIISGLNGINYQKFIEANPFFNEFMKNNPLILKEYNLNFLEENQSVIKEILELNQNIMPNILLKNKRVILNRPFSNDIDSIKLKIEEKINFYICDTEFLRKINITLNLKQTLLGSILESDLVSLIVDFARFFFASDIHVVLQEEASLILRIEGSLVTFFNFNKELYIKLSQKIKTLCGIDINDSRLPQDGHFFMNEQDIRASFLPSLNGESIALRIPTIIRRDINNLNLNTNTLEALKDSLLLKNGLILVGGPTGSGKSTLLYSSLELLNDGTKKIISIEDPIEQEIKNIVQCEVNKEIGFADFLKYILRQDPDVIMIGEIRDEETLKIALRAALTGHLVLASIHANDAKSSIERLKDLGASSSMIGITLNLVICTRLVKTLCKFCKTKKDSYYFAYGCDECYNLGYGKRMLIDEYLGFKGEYANASSSLESKLKHLKENGLVDYKEKL